MKVLTAKELGEAPAPIQMVYLWCLSGTPIGIRLWDELIRDYPEYFPDEIEYRRKWASIPDAVKEAYHAEYQQSYEALQKEYPAAAGRGIFWAARNAPENIFEYPSGKNISKPPSAEYVKWQASLKNLNESLSALDTRLYNKYFAPYGLTR